MFLWDWFTGVLGYLGEKFLFQVHFSVVGI